MKKGKQLNSPIIPFHKGDEYKGFTLIEILVGILIFAIVIVGGFKAYNGVLIGKIKLIESTNIQKQAFFFSEKFFEEIKKGGTIDYEEYFNRKVVNGDDTGNAIYTNGHYKKNTGFGNYGINGSVGSTTYGDGFYYCRSKNGTKMTGTGCVEDFASDINGNNIINISKKPQRYGQYSFQFIDYNSNYDSDKGDEDGDGNIIGDDDDEYLGFGPVTFSGSEVKEIYLISADKKKRTLFRWNIKDDPDNPTDNCNFTTGSGGCRSTIEFLKLEGKDWGFDHDTTSGGTEGQYDGVVDTWIIDKNFSGGAEVVAGSNSINYWQPLFGDNINVSNVKFFIYPNKDRKLAWQDSDSKININPYIRIQMTLSPSYKAKKGFRGKIPKIKVNTTINLTDIYSR